MRASRTFRVIFGIIVLILFGAYSYMRYTTSPHSSDFDEENARTYSEWLALAGVDAAPAEQTQQEVVVEEPVALEQETQTEAPAELPAEQIQQEPVVEEPAAPALPAIDINSWEYMLVNDANRLTAQDFPPQVVTVSDSQCPVDSRIAEPLMAMAQACKDAGNSVYLSSGYRSYSEQAANFTRVCNNNGVADGKDANGFYITMPAGASEHQTGLACDITDRYYEIKNASLENTATFQWLKANCTDFGFILRFPQDKQEITGVMYEPFHFRYVGVEVAKYMTENNLCLEEFVALYKPELAVAPAA